MKYFILIFAGLFSPIVASACGTDNCDQVRIDQLAVPNEGYILIYTTGNEQNLSACNQSYIQLNPDASNADRMYSALLARQAADKPVKLWVSTSSCVITRVQTKD